MPGNPAITENLPVCRRLCGYPLFVSISCSVIVIGILEGQIFGDKITSFEEDAGS
jgi:hypothetical protein